MKLFFTAKQIPGLESVSLQERLNAINEANQKLSKPEKLFLNLIKLLILIPIFVLLTGQFDIAVAAVGILICILLYPALLRPIQLTLISKHIHEGSKEEN